MFLKACILIFFGVISGVATSAGVIALLTKLGVVPRMIARWQVANAVLPCEFAVVLGAVGGCVLSITKTPGTWAGWMDVFFIQQGVLLVVALCSGIYVGCQAMALAEILNVFPILFRRAKLQLGLRYTVLAVAMGKLVGSLWYFIFGYQSS